MPMMIGLPEYTALRMPATAIAGSADAATKETKQLDHFSANSIDARQRSRSTRSSTAVIVVAAFSLWYACSQVTHLALQPHHYHAGSTFGYVSNLGGRFGWKNHHCRKDKHRTTQETESQFLAIPSPESARNASHSYTAVSHVAGTEGDRLSARRVKSQFESLLNLKVSAPEEHVYEAGSQESKRALMSHRTSSYSWWRRVVWRAGLGQWLPHSTHKDDSPRVWIDTYYPLLNYPIAHSLTLTPVGASTPSFVAKLLEDEIPEDSTSAIARFAVPTFHGLSKNGSATGQLVYAGFGTREEFKSLQNAGVNFTDKIVILRYGGSFRGLKVAAATEVGAIGCLIYSDPLEDGEVTEINGHLPYPAGPARQPSSVQRGSTQFLSSYPGDPLTPFQPAYRDAKRMSRDDPSINIPSIPSLPISYEDAIPLLKSLNGHGAQLELGGLSHFGVEYWSGPGTDQVYMLNHIEERVTPIWNTMTLIPGSINDEVVILGNHNDAWTLGGGDPNSGTASLHEIIKAFGVLLKDGWEPLRSIIVASWDAEEYGLIGSTEFGEDHSSWIQKNVVAYLNVDVAVSGSAYRVEASPSLADLFKKVSSSVQLKETGDSVLEKTEEELHVGALGSGSDFTVFLQHLGIASGNVGYSRKKIDPVYHYHSIYDSAYWQDTFGDPTFERHVTIARILGLATLRLVDSPLLPINVTAYAKELSYYLTKVDDLLLLNAHSAADGQTLKLKSLRHAIAKIQKAASGVEKEILKAEQQLSELSTESDNKRSSRWRALRHLSQRIHTLNGKLKNFEGGFIDLGGLPQRTWYRNLVVAPGRYLGYGATTLPALTEAIALDGDYKQAEIEVERLVKMFGRVAKALKA